MKLVIVESPTKCTTIKRYLGKNYIVVASLGHIRDLARSGKGGLGVDIENDFKPTYKISSGKYAVVKNLKEQAKRCDEVILATDPDREGEAIAWHLTQVLGLDVKTTKRLEFHEITRDSINHAINNPRTIDMNLVSSQETRRIIDRIIGFKLSTLLYNKIHSRSAGRVQSATLKIIADHEKEIENFVIEEYHKINVTASFNGQTYAINIKRNKPVSTTEEALEILNNIPENLEVIDVKKEVKKREAKAPFTTSTLQQAAYNKYKFKTEETQSIAHKLYEGIDLGGEHVGLISYMRTDSTRLSPTYINRAKNYIIEAFGEEYVGNKTKFKEGKMAQDAHEAIRPTGNHRTPDSIKQYLTRNQYLLYKLVYERTLASLMAPKKEEITTVTIKGNDIIFTLEGVRILFDGYERLSKEENSNKIMLPEIKNGDIFKVESKSEEQKFTQPPAHYSEAKIVNIMESVGIGRPSTYASTISTLSKRKYVTDADGVLKITDQGDKTSHVLDKYFPDIVNAKYTAQMEEKLDNIQAGSSSIVKMLNDFYNSFIKEFDKASKLMYKDEEEKTGENCPECGSPLIYKDGKFGRFICCSNYPKCNYIKKEPKEVVYTGENCPVCGKPLVERTYNKDKKFVACSGYPKCNYIKPDPNKPAKQEKQPAKLVGRKCPKCGNELVYRTSKRGEFIACSNFPKCRYIENIKKTGAVKKLKT